MIRFILAALLLFSSLLYAYDGNFPTVPDEHLSPGKLCTSSDPDFMRYYDHGLGKVPICDRNVSVQTKYEVLARYGIPGNKRSLYKIDHVIPLSIGGSNDIQNLFPINLKVTEEYERLEESIYLDFRDGRINQSDAVRTILEW